MVDWGREDLMSNMQKDNIGLITVRQVAEGVFNHCFITENIVESRITLSNKGIGYLFPLYLYKNEKDLNLFSQNEPELSPNISEKFTSKLIDTYVCFPSPENVLAYIYAVLFSNIYRSTYAPYLQFNYPRIPFTSDYQLFKSIAGIGQRLIDVHLLKSSELDLPVMKFQGKGDNQVIERPYYSEEEQRLYVNPQYYFEGLESELWNYKLCGYQVLSKYLKERKGQRMDDPRHYIRIATALGKTIEIQSEIDDLYPEVEKDVIKF